MFAWFAMWDTATLRIDHDGLWLYTRRPGSWVAVPAVFAENVTTLGL